MVTQLQPDVRERYYCYPWALRRMDYDDSREADEVYGGVEEVFVTFCRFVFISGTSTDIIISIR